MKSGQKRIKIDKKRDKKVKLIYTMSSMLVFFWLLPLLFLVYVLLFLMAGSLNSQIERTITTSADKAIEICIMQMDNVVMASRNASYMPTIKDSYLEYRRDGNEQDLYNDVTLFLTQQYKYNTYIENAILFFVDNSDEIYYTYGISGITNYIAVKEFEDKYQKEIMETMEKSDTGVKLLCIEDKIFLARNLVTSSFEPFAVLCFEINTESIFECLKSVWGAEGFRVYLNGKEMFTSNNYVETKLDTIQENYTSVNSRSIYLHEDSEAYVYKNIKESDNYIGIIIRLDSKAILDEMVIIRTISIILLSFMCFLILIIFFFLYRKVSRPIENLVDGADKITQGKYGYQIADISSSLEFYSLEKSFNAMSMELKRQFEKIYLEELELKDAQIMALQSQINPHFLNNTLEIINWECRMTGNTKTSSMIEALSVMLNATMNRRKQNMIPLSEELSYVDAYLLIIQQRFGSRLKIEKKIEHSILWVEVPRLIIQPIIENAVEHGMDAKNQGKVTIEIYALNDKVHIDVTNNGVMTENDRKKIEYLLGPDDKEDVERSTSLGIRNVNRRLKIIYGEESGLTIRSNEEGFTVSTIIIDMNYKDVEEQNEEDGMDE